MKEDVEQSSWFCFIVSFGYESLVSRVQAVLVGTSGDKWAREDPPSPPEAVPVAVDLTQASNCG